MALVYGIYINKETGLPPTGIVYADNDAVEAQRVTPADCIFVSFNEATKDFNLLYALLVDNSSGLASNLLPPTLGGLKYNFDLKEFEFGEAPPQPDLIDLIRIERNRLIADTDDLALVPDYPEELKQATLAYRQALRDITKNIDPSWRRVEDVQWPTPPAHH